jgi:hypothetical protein
MGNFINEDGVDIRRVGVERGTVRGMTSHPWQGIPPAVGSQGFREAVEWAWNNVTKIIERTADGKTRFIWQRATGPPPNIGALTCLEWVVTNPAKFQDVCVRMLSKDEGVDEAEGEEAKGERLRLEECRRILRTLEVPGASG